MHEVTYSIFSKVAVRPVELIDNIKRAFEIIANVDIINISVNVEEYTVKLIGEIHSITKKDELKNNLFCFWRV